MSTSDFTWLIGGPQGSGVESGANIFSKVCAEMGYHVFGKREFYSNIKGEHSYFTVRICDEKINSNVNDVSLMVSFDAETIFRHYDEVISGGGIIYDSDLFETKTSDVHTLDAPFKERLHKELELQNKPFTIAGVLEIAKEKGVLLYPVSFKSILATLAEETGNPRLKGLVRMFNVIGVALSLGLVKMPPDSLKKTIGDIFAKKEEIAKINQETAIYSYNYAAAKFESFNYELSGTEKEPHTILVQGFQGTALGKMVCGCRMQPYYPITPASDESVFLESNEIVEVIGGRPGSTAVIQCEDEICSIGMTIGSALTGTRASTCTSGPGFSLMTEMLGWAGMNEVPIVITNYQRSGPSTGLPTRHGQDDLLFSIYAGHGDFPKIVYASGDIEESFYDTGNCFNYADIFQVPVIHMMDKFHASSVITCKRFDPSKVTINRGKLLEKVEDGYRRFEFTEDGISPRSRLGIDNGIFWNTGDESDEWGHITEDPILRVKMMDKRMFKLDLILKDIPQSQQAVSFGVEDYTIISWGSAKGPILDAIDMLKKEGISIGYVQLKLLHPFPADYVTSLLKDAKTIIDIEANHSGQLGKLFKQNVSRDIDYFILKYTGRAMTCTEVYDSLKKIVENKADKREVLMHGA
ncbi:MAG: 2-oxoacid:acceptor oxidoreductase subunit alpha [Nitrosopumilus sp.]|uniref:2-oxoacid:ferredoxin oxidoreductase subunit alpha n=1 Tax=Nitrosopumilus zosterae TaxID=718286 RepID=A0A2S2KQ15_9ARCH|nr:MULTISPECIES: 2-oxoacid:ferredoxin oxidoreductase subunit alpha [Nitrosopumilus]MCV0367292.1 2-oxoacid:acceptor oxidoreductase subunit alpha [Nitrosopumilus sp.]BDQ31489.1 2-oxoacid:acceptor oxidoreductase subunit alpha [Nitrosopumilus zosterae]GBH33694.1 2-oxoacid:ferredoxin oxidoreductase subunit alpha [Nitrosopumilus zosterae]